MKFTGTEVLDSTIQRTNVWLKDLMQELNWPDKRKTYLAFRCVLQALRDHLPVKDAVYLGEQLPMLVRGFYFEHWEPEGKPLPLRSRDEFFSILSSYLERDDVEPTSNANADVVTRAVFRLLDRKATDGEIEDISHILPRSLLDLWPQALRAA
jgi:uncharacterized protein (DUF2267 family)